MFRIEGEMTSVLILFCFQLIEAIVLPMTHKERFERLGIQPPKGEIFR